MLQFNLKIFVVLFAGCCLLPQLDAQNSRDRDKLSLFDTKGDIKAFSKRMDDAETELELFDAIVDLGALYCKVVGDPRFNRSERLQGYRGRLAAKLQLAKRTIIKDQKKQAREESRYPGTDEESLAHNELETAIIDKHWRLVAHSIGGTGPTMYFASGMHGASGHFFRGHAAGAGQFCGQELIDLIEAVLHPDFWQSNGGAGVAHYYSPLRILVVRATTEVHEDLERLLETLR